MGRASAVFWVAVGCLGACARLGGDEGEPSAAGSAKVDARPPASRARGTEDAGAGPATGGTSGTTGGTPGTTGGTLGTTGGGGSAGTVKGALPPFTPGMGPAPLPDGGVGSVESCATPAIAMLAAGSDHTCALTKAGEIWCWGSNAKGQLARDPEMTPSSARPLRIEEIGTEGAFVATGDALTCAARRDGSAWCWGGGSVPADPKVRVAQVLGPGGAKLTDVVEIAIGRTAMARRKDGTALVWAIACEVGFGCGMKAQPLGGSAMGQISVNGPSKEETAFCGVGGDGSAYCAGWNTFGQLGLPMDKSTVLWKDFRRLDALGGDVAEVRVGWRFGCARKQDGSLWCWGANDIGQLGSGTQDRGTAMPTRAAGVGGAVRKLAFGAQNQVYAEIGDGNAWVWGANQYGQLGVPDQAALRAPTKTALFAGNGAIALGSNHTCILRGGDVWCVGLGEDGQLGNGRTKDSANLVRVRMCQ